MGGADCERACRADAVSKGLLEVCHKEAMMAFHVYYECDKCGVSYGWTDHSVSKGTAVYLARDKGWSVGKTGWYCPDCRRKARKQKKNEETH